MAEPLEDNSMAKDKKQPMKKKAKRPDPKLLGTGMARGAAEALKMKNKRLKDI